MLEGLPSVVLILSRFDKELVLEVLELGRRVVAHEAIFGRGASKQLVDVLSICLVVNEDFPPLLEEFLGAGP